MNQINLIWGSGKKEMSKKKGRGKGRRENEKGKEARIF